MLPEILTAGDSALEVNPIAGMVPRHNETMDRFKYAVTSSFLAVKSLLEEQEERIAERDQQQKKIEE
jgi:hypothetical protein